MKILNTKDNSQIIQKSKGINEDYCSTCLCASLTVTEDSGFFQFLN